MKTFTVNFDATTQVTVEAVDAETAAKIARRHLDPDVDWTVGAIGEAIEGEDIY